MSPPLVFVDTSAWYALLDRKDLNHLAAVRFVEQSAIPFVTSTYVLDETVTLAKRHLGHAAAVRFGDRLWKEEVARLVRISPEDEMRAWTLFTRYADKGFSYTDCTSFALMERLQLDSAFAFDAHFAQYGRFVRLPAI
ncbi:MAG TPA: PIN domain-containing protein [Thermoleophilia bacterium]|nr:PIN domain-containing protein [Thermoleophilia bacterium]